MQDTGITTEFVQFTGDVTTRLLLLLGVLVVAAVLGAVWRRRQGAVRTVVDGDVVAPAELGADLGAAATLVQFSTTTCAPCRTARRVLADVAATTPGVAHVELDAEEHLDLVRRFNVLRTPTVLVLDAAGRVAHRISGVPEVARLRETLPATAPAN